MAQRSSSCSTAPPQRVVNATRPPRRRDWASTAPSSAMNEMDSRSVGIPRSFHGRRLVRVRKPCRGFTATQHTAHQVQRFTAIARSALEHLQPALRRGEPGDGLVLRTPTLDLRDYRNGWSHPPRAGSCSRARSCRGGEPRQSKSTSRFAAASAEREQRCALASWHARSCSELPWMRSLRTRTGRRRRFASYSRELPTGASTR